MRFLFYDKVVNKLCYDKTAMDVKKIILEKIKTQGAIKAAEAIKATGFSRNYVNRFFQELIREGKIILIGKANQARYISATKTSLLKALSSARFYRSFLKNENIEESAVLNTMRAKTGILDGLAPNVAEIVDYGFTKMLNNAIEHSGSKNIEIKMQREQEKISFRVADKGVGIFKNIMAKKGLANELEAVQDLLKGKQTTAPEAHSGEGIFFTSRAADALVIKSSQKKLIFDGNANEFFLRDINPVKGTSVEFEIGLGSKINLADIFRAHAFGAFDFGKTAVKVALYKISDGYISRSQARRVLIGLDKFKIVELDFAGVETIGQGFADEVFRVWQKKHPDIKIVYKNAAENVEFMIKRAQTQ